METKIEKKNCERELNSLKIYLENEKYKTNDLKEIVEHLDNLFFMSDFNEQKKKEDFLNYVGSENWEKLTHTIEFTKIRLIKAIVNL